MNLLIKKAAAARRRLFQHYLRRLDVKPGTVFYHAYRNRIMAGNPYAIFKKLMEEPDFRDFHHYWVYDSEDSLGYDTFRRYAGLKNVHFVKASTPAHLKAMATCQYLVNNAAMPDYWTKRPGQTYINTWHGTPLKMLGKHAKDSKASSIINAQRNFLMSDYLVMPNRFTADKLLDSYDIDGLYHGTIVDAGYPRNDLPLVTDAIRIRGLLEQKSGRPLENKRVVLYAPTFRSEDGVSLDTSDETIVSIESLIALMPDGYELFFKVHNTLGRYFKDNKKIQTRLIFDEIETNELLSATDVLITDYSSIFFDFLATSKPCLFFVYDREEYESGRGLNLPVDSLPGAICMKVEDIVANLELISSGGYDHADRHNEYRRLFAYNDDGQASTRIVDHIFRGRQLTENYLYKPGREGACILIDGGGELTAEKTAKMKYLFSQHSTETSNYFLMLDEAPLGYLMAPFLVRNLRIVATSLSGTIWHVGFDALCCLDSETAGPSLGLARACDASAEGYFCQEEFQALRRATLEAFDKIYVIEEEHAQADRTSNPGQEKDGQVVFVSREDFNRQVYPTEKLSVMFLSGTDSMNNVYTNCISALLADGHEVYIVVQDEKDTVTNRAYDVNGWTYIAASKLDQELTNGIDYVFLPPLRLNAYKKIYANIKRKNIFTVSFATLFSSVAMRSYPDLLFLIGYSKYEELKAYHLRYNWVLTGSPEYDKFSLSGKPSAGKPHRLLIVDQGGYPYGEKGKSQMASFLMQTAAENPDIAFDIKLRYVSSDKDSQHHSVSEYLMDYLSEKPSNLNILPTDIVLEDILCDYDGMITTWSTAYLTAAMAGIPLLILEGFDSIDVFDVRNKRASDAYEHLRQTGCVWDYRQIPRGKIPLQTVAQDYMVNEVYRWIEPAGPRIVRLLRQGKMEMVLKGRRLEIIVPEGADTLADTMAQRSFQVTDERYWREKEYRSRLNECMQEAVFENRCMADVLDLEPLEHFYDDELAALFMESPERSLESDFTSAYMKIKNDYFESSDFRQTIESDVILQDFWLDWLYKTGQYAKLENPGIPLSARASLELYQGLGCLHNNKREAYRHLNCYLRLCRKEGPKQTLSEKRVSVSTLPFRTGLGKLRFYWSLMKYDNLEALTLFPKTVRSQNAIVSYLLIRQHIKNGDKAAAAIVYARIRETQTERGRKKSGGSLSRVKRIPNRIFRKLMMHLIEREYRNVQ